MAFPSSACVVDVIRCSFTYDNCKIYLREINKFINNVNENENHLMNAKKTGKEDNKQQLHCITKILRIKNTFRELISKDSTNNTNDRNDKKEIQMSKFEYADIKINVLISNEDGSIQIIGETQWLLNMMQNVCGYFLSALFCFPFKQTFLQQLQCQGFVILKLFCFLGDVFTIGKKENAFIILANKNGRIYE